MKKDNFNKGVNKIISNLINNIDIRENSYIPDENKFSDFVKFKEECPDGDYLQFRKFCQEVKRDDQEIH